MRSCVNFDFDGVVADTEELHFEGYNRALAASAGGIGGLLTIGHDDYMARYCPYGDFEAFSHMLEDNGRPSGSALIAGLIDIKSLEMERLLSAVTEPLPGVRDTLDILDRLGVPRAICSSAATSEIRQVLSACRLLDRFELIIGIEDVTHSKPDPEGYEKAFRALNASHGGVLELGHSLAVEDSCGGADAARAAGLRVLGVATNLPIDQIGAHATWAVESLVDASEADWRGWLGR